MSVLILHLVALISICITEPSYAFMNDERPVSRSQIYETSPSAMTPVSKDQTNVSTRAEYIKKRIEKNKKWHGGHSPIPSRVVTMETIRAVKQELSLEDSAALIVLLQDDASDIQFAAASLLACVNPDAQNEIEKLMIEETNSQRLFRFKLALRKINSIREGRTLCE